MSDPDTIHFLAFLEEIARVSPRSALLHPGGGPLVPHSDVLDRRCFRATFSGFRRGLFSKFEEHVRPSELSELAGVDAEERRAGLVRAFEGLPVPIVQVFWSEHGRWPSPSRKLLVNRWFELSIYRPFEEAGEFPVYLGEPDPVETVEELTEGQLVNWRRVDPRLEARLRDVFSLKHLPSADIGPADEGPAGPPPPDGPGPELAPEGPAEPADAGRERRTQTVGQMRWHAEPEYGHEIEHEQVQHVEIYP